jgi:hypothetical protein
VLLKRLFWCPVRRLPGVHDTRRSLAFSAWGYGSLPCACLAAFTGVLAEFMALR